MKIIVTVRLCQCLAKQESYWCYCLYADNGECLARSEELREKSKQAYRDALKMRRQLAKLAGVGTKEIKQLIPIRICEGKRSKFVNGRIVVLDD